MIKPTQNDYLLAKASQIIRKHEGVRTHPYHDTVGKITIGVGRNLTDRGLSVDEINLLFENDMVIASQILDSCCPNWHSYSLNRRAALLSMAFNLGGPRLMRFVKMRKALAVSDFEEAARQALDSRWARQVGIRAIEICDMIEAG